MTRKMLQSALCICLSPLLAAQQVSEPAPSAPAVKAAHPSAPSGTVRIPAYTPVNLRLEQRVSSADAHVGDRVCFTLVNDLAANGRVVAPAGTSLFATVRHVHPKSKTRNGYVRLSGPELDLGLGQRIRFTDATSDVADDVEMAIALLTAAAISSPIWVPQLLFELARGTTRPRSAVTPNKRPEPVDSVLLQGRRLIFVTRRAERIRVDRLVVAQSPGPG